MLTADTEAPVVTETTVGADLLQALEIITELGVDTVGEDLRVLAIDDVTLTVEEPLLPSCQYLVLCGHHLTGKTYAGDLVGGGVLDDGDQALKLLRGELTGALVQVDIGLLAHKVGCRVQLVLCIQCLRGYAEASPGTTVSSRFAGDIQ